MITVPQASEIIIKRSRFLSEAMTKGILNYSSLARYIRPEVEKMLTKNISEASILMALKRLRVGPTKFTNILFSSPEMLIRSHLVSLYVKNTKNSNFQIQQVKNKTTLFLMQGSSQTTIVGNKNSIKEIKKLFIKEDIQATFNNLSAITIYLAKDHKKTPNIFYFFLKSLAW